ncbi:kelch-like protein 1 [Glandiceps talaboti]
MDTTVTQIPRKTSAVLSTSKVCYSELVGRIDHHVDRLMAHFNEPAMSDVIIKVGQQRYYVSKFLLSSCSTVFRTMLIDAKWSDAKKTEICLEESNECLPVFEDFLKFMYCGQISLSVRRVLPVVILADKYDMTSLKNLCEGYMIDTIVLRRNVDGAMQWLSRAEVYGLKMLSKLCFDVIIFNLQRVIEKPEWLDIDFATLCRVLKSTESYIADEYTLFKGVEKWITNKLLSENETDAGEEFAELLPWLHFTAMTPSQIYDVENSVFGKKYKLKLQEYVTMGYRYHALRQEFKALQPSLPSPPLARVYSDKIFEESIDLRWDLIPFHNAGACHANFTVNVNTKCQDDVIGKPWNVGINFTESQNCARADPQLDANETHHTVRDLLIRLYPYRSHAGLNYQIIVVLVETSSGNVWHVVRKLGQVISDEPKKLHQRPLHFFQTPITCNLSNLLHSENLKLCLKINLEKSDVGEEQKYQVGLLNC